MATINVVAIATHLRISSCNIIAWVLPAVGITGILIVALIVCSLLIGDRVGSPALRLVIIGSIAVALIASGFRLFISRTKRQMFSNYVFPEMSRPVISIGRIFGLPASSA